MFLERDKAYKIRKKFNKIREIKEEAEDKENDDALMLLTFASEKWKTLPIFEYFHF